MHTDEFNNVLNELLKCTQEISDDRNHLKYTEGYGVYGRVNRQYVIKSLEENQNKQELLKNKLILLYNNTLKV
jgi:hypothetical protein